MLFLKILTSNKILNSIIIKLLFLFFCIITFILFQNPKIYHNSLAKVSTNYVAIDVRNYNIIQLDTPYLKPTLDKFYRWDAWFYSSIKDNSYKEDNSGTEGRFAFFPLFPIVWKLTTLKINQIGFFNVLLAILGIVISVRLFIGNQNSKLELWTSNLIFILPTSISYFLPYSESLFLLTFTVGSYFILKGNKTGYLVLLTLFAMTRPAFTIVLLAILAVQLLIFLFNENSKKIRVIKNTIFLIFPLLFGTLLVITIQYPYSNKIFKFYEVQTIWNHVLRFPNTLSDWSVESFGNSIAVLTFVSIPSIALLIYELFTVNSNIKVLSKKYNSIFDNKDYAKEFLYLVSILYIIGVTVFILLWQGGSLNGLSRYILCSPFFIFFVSHFILNKTYVINKYLTLFITIILIILSSLLLTHIQYSPEIEFRDLGFALTSIILILLFNIKTLIKFKFFTLVCYLTLSFLSAIWLTYMFNIFLSDGWLFT